VGCRRRRGPVDIERAQREGSTARHRAPAVHLEWNEIGILHAFRNDVPSHERSEALKVVKAEWPFSAMIQPTVTGELQRVLGGNGRSYSGPVFIAPEGLVARGDAVRITAANLRRIQGYHQLPMLRQALQAELGIKQLAKAG
jgi:hypothetical protein